MIRWTLLLLLALPAQAHRPGALDDTVIVSDPTISWTYTGTFDDGDEVYTLQLHYDAPFAAPFEILVPTRKAWEDFRPAYAIVGPGLPVPSDLEVALLPKDLPEGLGAFIAWNDAPERDVYFEAVMRRTLWSSGTTAVALQAGDFEIWIWSPDGATGDFQMAFGVEENFEGDAWGPLFDNWGDFAW